MYYYVPRNNIVCEEYFYRHSDEETDVFNIYIHHLSCKINQSDELEWVTLSIAHDNAINLPVPIIIPISNYEK